MILSDKIVQYLQYLLDVGIFSFRSTPMMVATTASEHRSEGQRGFTQQREQGGDDEDADGDHEKTENRNGSDHTDESLWKRVLVKYTELDARLTALEEDHGTRRTG